MGKLEITSIGSNQSLLAANDFKTMETVIIKLNDLGIRHEAYKCTKYDCTQRSLLEIVNIPHIDLISIFQTNGVGIV